MEIKSIYKYLPVHIVYMLDRLDGGFKKTVNEVRLRAGGRLCVFACGKLYPVEDYVCTVNDIEQTVEYASKASMYALDHAVKNGYIPLDNGGRMGICGDTLCKNGEIMGFSSVNSLCIRIPRNINCFAGELVSYFDKQGIAGTLVISPPGMGKTTYLKSAIYLLSEKYKVAVADERYELCSCGAKNADFITGCVKSKAISLLTRTMSPQIIVCDEISENEADKIYAAQNSGCVFIASCHGADSAQVKRREYINKMIENNVFELAINLYFDGGYKSLPEKL